eukprot:TRINITY_DN67759_c5_g2_i1.p1 TRINITY_DN67759_c5_g2~~TRINITY_DN67759_c5_g2_i1.p1  ORF type:complete len:208 (+),score=17.03 TRINITY_DN67759_c5_g2_i1:32-655(+)
MPERKVTKKAAKGSPPGPSGSPASVHSSPDRNKILRRPVTFNPDFLCVIVHERAVYRVPLEADTRSIKDYCANDNSFLGILFWCIINPHLPEPFPDEAVIHSSFSPPCDDDEKVSDFAGRGGLICFCEKEPDIAQAQQAWFEECKARESLQRQVAELQERVKSYESGDDGFRAFIHRTATEMIAACEAMSSATLVSTQTQTDPVDQP